MAWLRTSLTLGASIAGALTSLLYWKQNELIYPRSVPPGSRTEVPRPADFPDFEFHPDSQELSLITPDGETISAFLLRPRARASGVNAAAGVTVIMFHGNAGNIGHRLPIAGMFQLTVPCNILMVEYRGYGLSTGTPDERGINIDAQTAVDYVRQHDDLKKTSMVLYGQSLGGAVAINLAHRNSEQGDIKALILENTFLSIRKLIPSAFPPAKYLVSLCHQFWNSEEVIPKLTEVPILFLSGQQDEIVP